MKEIIEAAKNNKRLSMSILVLVSLLVTFLYSDGSYEELMWYIDHFKRSLGY